MGNHYHIMAETPEPNLVEEVAYHLSLPVSELPRAFFRLRVLLEP